MLKPLCILPAFAFALYAMPAQEPATAPAAPVAAAAAAAPTIPANPTTTAKSNPLKPTPEVLAKAKKMYGYDCAMCHGEKGDGKGDLVADMKLTLKDFTNPASLKDMSDGDMYTIIKNGKGQMVGEGDRAKSDDVWALVLLLRSFSNK